MKMVHFCLLLLLFFFNQKTAYEVRISDWSSDVCSSDLEAVARIGLSGGGLEAEILSFGAAIRALQFAGQPVVLSLDSVDDYVAGRTYFGAVAGRFANRIAGGRFVLDGTSYQLPCNEAGRSEEHTTDIQSLMRTTSAVFCLKK